MSTVVFLLTVFTLRPSLRLVFFDVSWICFYYMSVAVAGFPWIPFPCTILYYLVSPDKIVQTYTRKRDARKTCHRNKHVSSDKIVQDSTRKRDPRKTSHRNKHVSSDKIVQDSTRKRYPRKTSHRNRHVIKAYPGHIEKNKTQWRTQRKNCKKNTTVDVVKLANSKLKPGNKQNKQCSVDTNVISTGKDKDRSLQIRCK